jgi:hypothetical protein
MKKIVIICVIAFLLQACSIKQNITKMPENSLNQMKEICIIQNPAVKKTFLPVYINSFENYGISTKTIQPTAKITDCYFTSTYNAKWSWDLRIYLAYVEMNIYENGHLTAKAIYDSTSGSGNMDKFITAEDKVRELVHGMLGKQ